ncbi:hypothetical protein QR680_006017 [Steinernema hermaphroditum]|uniref:C-type lectin domain-containing protein n=1 Tax=Steinernema hermaphroditum TaxID=289476 RepID=A0AA39LWP1_9BILA|nr:hypothetical protein QR680_006017 [Steinernema hermaphroditum]
MRLLLTALLFLSPLAIQAIPRTTCENARVGDHCFQVQSQLATFSEAQQFCQTLGGNLSSIRDEYENMIVSHITYTLIHDGLKAGLFWIGGQFTNSRWVWRDGKPLTFQNFAKIRDHLYIVNRHALTWEDAEQFCVDQNGHLSSILSKEEADFVTSLMKNENINFDFWIGGRREGEQFHWADGSSWDFTDFHYGQPNGISENSCLQIYDANFKEWMNYDCKREFPSVCKIRTSVAT